MSLTQAQQQVLNTIIQVGIQRGLTTEQIIRMASVAELESTLNPNAPNNQWGAGGLFQYKDKTWDWAGFTGSKFNTQDATNAFVSDLLKYENEYNANSNVVRQRIALMEKNDIEGTLENYILYRHNRSLSETGKMASKWEFDPEERFDEIGTYIEPNYVPGPYNPSNPYGLLPSTGLPDMIAPWTDLFDEAAAVPPPRLAGTPIVLDLDGDGVETTGLNEGAYFDHDKNGFAEKIGWAGSDDGLLAWDKNSDGIINDGAELFNTTMPDGSPAENGFQVLTTLDDNQDGKIDVNDAIWGELKIWQDIDGDGYSASDELFTLDELGIQSINTGYTTSTYVDENGNEHRQVGSYTKTDSTTLTATDVWFQTDKAYTMWFGVAML